MTSYDKNGRLRITLSSTGSTGGGSLAVRASGALGSVSATNVTTLTFSGSFLTASNPNSGQVNVSYFENAPIMFLSGFRCSSTNPAHHNFYIVTSSGFFSGSENFMCSVLYSSPWPSQNTTHLAGNGTGPTATLSEWKLIAWGTDWYTDDSLGVDIGSWTALIAPGASAFNKWHLAYMYYSVNEINQGKALLDQPGADYDFGVSVPTWNTTVSFSIGGYGNGFTQDGTFDTRIAAVALATGSYVKDKETLFRYFQQVVKDGDIVQNGIMNWNHIWSVKQNTPGAVWRDAVGSFHLNRSGTLTIGTESTPRWP